MILLGRGGENVLWLLFRINWVYFFPHLNELNSVLVATSDLENCRKTLLLHMIIFCVKTVF